MKTSITYLVVLFSAVTSHARADTFGSGADTINIEFINIGNPDNPDDITGYPNPVGKVEYVYRMGKYEISYDMVQKANALGGLGITSDWNGGVNHPATYINWFEAAKFVNWLNTSTFHTPAYKFNGNTFALWQPGDPGYNPNNLFRNSQAFYFLPSADEWYKAAYYDPVADVYYDYPTGSNTVPTQIVSGTAPNTAVYGLPIFMATADITLAGGLSPYGTMAQGGNAWEWQETEYDLVNDSVSSHRLVRGQLGQCVHRYELVVFCSGAPDSEATRSTGFRIASIVPEPSTLLLAIAAFATLLTVRRRTDFQ